MGPEYEAPGKVPSKANTKMEKKAACPPGDLTGYRVCA